MCVHWIMPRTISTTFRDGRPCTERKPENRSGLLLPFTRITRMFVRGWSKHSWRLGGIIYICPEISISAEVVHGIIIAIFVPSEQTGQMNTRTPSIIPLTSPMLFWLLSVWNPERKVRKCKFHVRLSSLAHPTMVERIL